MEFKTLKAAVAKQFDRMTKHGLFRTGINKDALWETYLGSFPAGTNPIFRTRAEYDCTCCKQFIRAVGDSVAIIDGKIESIWDISIPKEPNFQIVVDAMSRAVKAMPIENVFLHYERKAGTDTNFERHAGGEVTTWNHFFVNIPAKFVVSGKDIGTKMAGPRSLREVMQRGLAEITPEAVSTVLELIAQRSLYRGDEHKGVVEAFQKLQKQYRKLTSDLEKSIFTWTNVGTVGGAVASIRGSAIGSLLTDLSEGKDLESSVGSFEAKVAPANYKRPTSLITESMIKKAKEKLSAEGLLSATERRHATMSDITINNIMFADRAAKAQINGDVFDTLAPTAGAKKSKLDKIEEVSIERFLADILPKAESIEVMMANEHASNLVSLIAPVDPTAGALFKWDNRFSWSYNGEMADSIKERVKSAGGAVVGDVCVRLGWFNFDDLDLHIDEPDGGHVYFGTRGRASPCGGTLDVDMNAGVVHSREAVENIVYGNHRHMKEGIYTVRVHSWSKRETKDVGFEVEIDLLGEVFHFSHPTAVQHGENTQVAQIEYSRAEGLKIISSIGGSKMTSTREVWGIPTNTFAKVNVVMMSPNYWDEKTVGNKHYFFMLDGCVNEGSARGFFNEFLREDLNEHRKVLEVVGSKMKVVSPEGQLSGLGFSSTQKSTLVCRVKGSFTRTVKIVF